MRRGLVLGAASALAMGGSAPALKVLAGSELSPVNVIQARMAIGAVTLLFLALVTKRDLRVPRSEWWLIGLYGGLGLALNQVVYTAALTRMPVGLTLLIEYLAPVLIALWIRFVRREHLPARLWVGIAATLAGLALISQVWTSVRLDGLGMLAALAAAVTYAGRFLFAERALRTHDPLVLATWGAGFGTMVLVPLEPFPFAQVGTQEVWLLVWVGVVGLAASVLLTVLAQRTLPSTAASLISCLEIVIGGALAAVLLGEHLTPVQLLGSAVMLGGIVVAQLALASGRRKHPEASELMPSSA
ncbi:DMT family transporter [Actinokineospora sp. HUAS TT18]|uniref:DMT family transporter n=1 Tax=Actinokineospora sp. HUAS TT18 TaxID=3447451 RepID=UPI003F52906C